MKISIMGAGAIGSLFGGYLKNAGQDVTLIGRDWNIEPIKERGLELIPHNSDKKLTIRINATTDPNELEYQELIILTVKAYDTKRALKDMKPIVEDDYTRILCLQNGYGTENIAADLYSKAQVLRGTTSNGAQIKPGLVIHTGQGDTHIGRLVSSTKVDDIIEIFNSTKLKAKFVENINKIVWNKVLVNVAINPFGALTNLKNGQLLEHSNIVECMKIAVSEGIEVLKSHGLKLNKQKSIQKAIKVAERTADNKNSMLQDIEKGKRTEIKYINGAISELSKEKNIETPMNDLLTALIKGLEYSKIKK
ncbi:MAG: 2-dehydropantoate 2-reductase [Candidatus Lokiarchaeota archaeon]|nr:2-dehydropantoate 2-reductase [Candidatus Lokiarchaeota archaeon]